MKKPTEPSLTELADAAFLQAARKVVERAKAFGTPIIVWEKGAIKRLKPDDVKLEGGRRKRKGPR
jgi:hypothetical protein